MATKGVSKISGPVNPVIGEQARYVVTEWYPATTPADKSDANIKWELFKKKSNGRYVSTNVIKKGPAGTFVFEEKASNQEFFIESYLDVTERKGQAILHVKPVKGKPAINGLRLLDNNKAIIKEKPKYGQTLVAEVKTQNMFGTKLSLQVWERDTVSDTGHDPKENTLLYEKNIVVNEKGLNYESIVLTELMMKKSNGGGMSSILEGNEHEYYLVVKQNEVSTYSSQTVQVLNKSIQVKGIGGDLPEKPDGKSTSGVAKVKAFSPGSVKCMCNRDMTVEELMYLGVSKKNADKFTDEINWVMKKYSINTCKRKLHFLTQILHECGNLASLEERTKNKNQYEGNKVLGNTEPGDGYRFKGRGFMQLTGRNNYAKYGNYVGQEFTTEPGNEKLADFPYRADSAGWFWSIFISENLNTYADKDDIQYITYRINGGFTHFIERRKPLLIAMIKTVKCDKTKFENYEKYSVKNSVVWDKIDAVYRYAELPTDESIDCYKRYLELTDQYLSWANVKKSPKKKSQIEKKRELAYDKTV